MSSSEVRYGIQPETGLVHAFTWVTSREPCWVSRCHVHLVVTWTQWKRAPDDATPTCLGCAIGAPERRSGK